jgi:hypothetical protein|tara:strand:+ start:21046 stop:21216 length:171 start_codon:yes stop_codon:yes gene_type:complete
VFFGFLVVLGYDAKVMRVLFGPEDIYSSIDRGFSYVVRADVRCRGDLTRLVGFVII